MLGFQDGFQIAQELDPLCRGQVTGGAVDLTARDLQNFMYYLRMERKTKKGAPLSTSTLDNAWKAIRIIAELLPLYERVLAREV